ncbi:MAG: pitrilysin family protein, partial [Cyanobacteria bacterium P01_F01_bin.42]
VIDEKTLASEKRVVISELQGYENSPSYRLGKLLTAQALGRHPYGLPVGGTKADVETFTLEQVEDYYRQHYRPQNAVLVITGDIDAEQVLQLVSQTFGAIANGPPPEVDYTAPLRPPTPVSEPLTLQEPGSVVLMERLYPLVANRHPDVPALDLMDAILSVGHQSRLHQAMVETGLVTSASGYSATLMDGGWYDLSIAAPPDADVDAIRSALDQTLDQMCTEPVSELELQRARTQLTTQFIFSNRDIDTQGSQLAYNEVATGDYQFSDRYLDALPTVTPDDIQRVAHDYLGTDRATEGCFIPSQISDQPMVMASPQTQEDFGTSQPVDPEEVAAYLPDVPDAPLASQVSPERLVLENGMRVVLLADHSSPTVTLAGHIAAGNGFDPPGMGGLAALVANNVTAGTTQHTELELAEILEAKGLYLSLQSFREGVDVEGYALSQYVSVLMETLSEVLQTAVFPEDKLSLSRARMANRLKTELDDPGRVGRRHFQQTLFPAGHPFHEFPTLESVAALTRSDVARHYQQTYRPDGAVLTLVGDFEPGEMKSQIEVLFGAWRAEGEAPELSYPNSTTNIQAQTINVPLAGKSQVATYMGHQSFNRSDPRYYAALILNEILGGDTLSSRLGNEIRDRLGLTYGIYSYFSSGAEVGSFIIEMQTSPEDTQQAIKSTIRLIEDLVANGVSESEFKAIQRSLLNAYPVEYANPDHVAQRLLLHEVDGLELEEMQRVPQRIAAVTFSQVSSIISELIHPDRMVIVNAGPVQQLD